MTLERDPRDIILVQGMRFTIDRPGRTIVAAETASTLQLLSPVGRYERMGRALAHAAALLRAAWGVRGLPRILPPA